MNLGRQMTFLGLAALAYYAVLLTVGILSADVMPQFLVSAIIFLSSGRLLRGASAARSKKLDKDGSPRKEPNWALLTQLLNWGMAVLILCALGLWVIKPVGVPFFEFLHLVGPLGHEANWEFVSEVPPP